MSGKKKKKSGAESPIDDGRVIADMNVDGLPWYRKNDRQDKKKRRKDDPDRPTKKETRAMIRAAYKAYFPYIVIVLCVLAAVYVIGYLYLR